MVTQVNSEIKALAVSQWSFNWDSYNIVSAMHQRKRYNYGQLNDTQTPQAPLG